MSQVISIIDYMIDQHREILHTLGRIESTLAKISDDHSVINTALFKQDILTLDQRLKSHKRTEEETIFPLMAAFTGYDGPASFVKLEHSRIWDLLEMLKTFVQESQTEVSNEAFSETFSALNNLVRLHIEKENQIIYPQVEKVLKNHFQSQIVKDIQTRLSVQSG